MRTNRAIGLALLTGLSLNLTAQELPLLLRSPLVMLLCH